MKPVDGHPDARRLRFGMVVSRFNESVTSRLETSARETLTRHGARDNAIRIVHVPGAFEIPLVAGRLAKSGHCDAVICLGAVIRGDTPHFDLISAEVSRGIAEVSRDTGIPVIFGVLTTNTLEDAMARTGTADIDRGADAARTAIDMATIMKALHDLDMKPDRLRSRRG